MKTMYFESFEDFEKCEARQDYEMIAVVKRSNGLCADLMTECKNWKTALNRFFKGLKTAGFDDLAGWKDTLVESCENGYFADKETFWEDGKSKYKGGYFWEVENYGDCWYVALKA